MTGLLDTADPVAVWTDVLRAYAATLDEQRGFLLGLRPDGLRDDESVLPAPFPVPDRLPPLPASLVAWAHALQRETAGLAELATEARDQIPAPPVRPRSPQVSATPATVDRTL